MSGSSFAPYRPFEHGRPAAGLTVRPATASDLPAIAEVAASRGGPTGRLMESVAVRIADPDAVIVVATLPPGDVVGWSGVAHWRGGDGAPEGLSVCGLTVAPRARRRGAGAAMLASCIAWAAPRGDLWSTCSASNEASLALHRRLGFTEERRGPRFGPVVFDCGEGVLLRWTGHSVGADALAR